MFRAGVGVGQPRRAGTERAPRARRGRCAPGDDMTEPTYEFRVLCADGQRRMHYFASKPFGLLDDRGVVTDNYEKATWALAELSQFPGLECAPHRIERRAVGPWEAT